MWPEDRQPRQGSPPMGLRAEQNRRDQRETPNSNKTFVLICLKVEELPRPLGLGRPDPERRATPEWSRLPGQLLLQDTVAPRHRPPKCLKEASGGWRARSGLQVSDSQGVEELAHATLPSTQRASSWTERDEAKTELSSAQGRYQEKGFPSWETKGGRRSQLRHGEGGWKAKNRGPGAWRKGPSCRAGSHGGGDMGSHRVPRVAAETSWQEHLPNVQLPGLPPAGTGEAPWPNPLLRLLPTIPSQELPRAAFPVYGAEPHLLPLQWPPNAAYLWILTSITYTVFNKGHGHFQLVKYPHPGKKFFLGTGNNSAPPPASLQGKGRLKGPPTPIQSHDSINTRRRHWHSNLHPHPHLPQTPGHQGTASRGISFPFLSK